MNEYWKKRIEQDEKKAQIIAKNYSKLEKKYYDDALKILDGKIDRLYTKIKWGGAETVSRSELWEYAHYLDLKDEIMKQCQIIGEGQVTLTEAAINEVFETTLGMTVGEGAQISGFNRYTANKFLNTNWSGQNYSTRIYNNTNVLAARLNMHISDMVVMGRSPEDIKKEFRYEFGVSYREADRLVRTEASYAFNSAAIQRYKDGNIKQVEILVEKDGCPLCQALKEKQYDLASAPLLPVHPNCRCAYIPVV